MMESPALLEALGRLEQDRRLHEAEQDRLVRLVRAARGKRILIGRAPAWLGQRLIAWGLNLQRRGGYAVANRCQPC